MFEGWIAPNSSSGLARIPSSMITRPPAGAGKIRAWNCGRMPGAECYTIVGGPGSGNLVVQPPTETKKLPLRHIQRILAPIANVGHAMFLGTSSMPGGQNKRQVLIGLPGPGRNLRGKAHVCLELAKGDFRTWRSGRWMRLVGRDSPTRTWRYKGRSAR